MVRVPAVPQPTRTRIVSPSVTDTTGTRPAALAGDGGDVGDRVGVDVVATGLADGRTGVVGDAVAACGAAAPRGVAVGEVVGTAGAAWEAPPRPEGTKASSPAAQTFLVQLAGAGTYIPSPRAAAGGGYGAQAQSDPVGAEGGMIRRKKTAQMLDALWK